MPSANACFRKADGNRARTVDLPLGLKKWPRLEFDVEVLVLCLVSFLHINKYSSGSFTPGPIIIMYTQ